MLGSSLIDVCYIGRSVNVTANKFLLIGDMQLTGNVTKNYMSINYSLLTLWYGKIPILYPLIRYFLLPLVMYSMLALS